MSDENFTDPIETRNRENLKSIHLIITTLFPIGMVISVLMAGWSFLAMFYYQNMHYNIAQMIYNGIVCTFCIVVISILVVGYTFIKIMVRLEGYNAK